MQKPQCWGQGLNMSLVPQVFLFIPGEWGGTSITLTENDLEELLVWYFPNFGEVKELKLCR
jgi:hypothetical protein